MVSPFSSGIYTGNASHLPLFHSLMGPLKRMHPPKKDSILHHTSSLNFSRMSLFNIALGVAP